MSRHGVLWRDNRGVVSDWAGNWIYNTYPLATTTNVKKTKHSSNQEVVNKTSAIMNVTTIILGPIIPKVGSTMLRIMSGNKDRPRGLRPRHTPKPNRSSVFQLAVVRNPIDHFLSIYRQIGAGSWYFSGGGNESLRYRSWPIEFCKATEEQREQWFRQNMNVFIKSKLDKRNEHNLPQLHYLQNYFDSSTIIQEEGGLKQQTQEEEEGQQRQQEQQEQKASKVPVVDRIDALLHLEDWDEGWKLATEQSKQISQDAYEWMQSHTLANKLPERNPLPKDYKKTYLSSSSLPKRDNANDNGWEPLCGEDGAEPYFRYHNITHPNNKNWRTRTSDESEEEILIKQQQVVVTDPMGNRLESVHDFLTAMHLLRYNYGRKHIWKYLPELCDYLKVDLECLQYDLPVVCQQQQPQ